MRRLAMRAFRSFPTPLRRFLVRLGTPSYTVGAVLVLSREDGCVLLVDQRHSAGWALPGGHLRRGEDPVDGVLREVREEVGLRLERTQLPPPIALVDAPAQRVDLVFVLDHDGQQPRRADEDEVLRLGWFALDALPDITESTRAILQSVPAA